MVSVHLRLGEGFVVSSAERSVTLDFGRISSVTLPKTAVTDRLGAYKVNSYESSFGAYKVNSYESSS